MVRQLDVDKYGHFQIEKYNYCPNCGADQFDLVFGCWSCGGKFKRERKSKYLEIIEIEKKPKTKVFLCRNKLTGDRLGIIKWYPPFRKYAFFSEPDIVYDRNCLEDIINFIDGLSAQNIKIKQLTKQ